MAGETKNNKDFKGEIIMGKIYKSIVELVGKTPLVELTNYEKNNNLEAKLYGKLEYFNPTGSIKDRAAVSMILAAEKEGKIKPGDTIVENTSGNTGIGLAAFAAARGYKLEVFLEPGQSPERAEIMKAYGVKVNYYFDLPVVGEKIKNGEPFTIDEFIGSFENYAASKPGHYFINQLSNPNNPGAHYNTTGPEIWEDTDGKVDIVVGMMGTAGTIHGTTKFLKEKNPDLKVYVVQPAVQSRISAENPHPNTIDGVVPFAGPGFSREGLSEFHRVVEYDEYIDVVAEDAYATGKELAQSDGIFLGQSAAAALNAATLIAKREENKGKNIVVLMADNGYKYLSTNMYK